MADGFTFEWHGDDILRRAQRAINRGSVALAETIVSGAKQNVHRVTGTLSRSIHAAPLGYVGENDYESAKAGVELTDGQYMIPSWKGSVAYVWVGSWIPYACVEESRHPYVYPAVEQSLGDAIGIYKLAFAEEGLS